MALYLGSNKKKLYQGDFKALLNIYISSPSIISSIRLLSSDNYILKDINNLYLTVKESE